MFKKEKGFELKKKVKFYYLKLNFGKSVILLDFSDENERQKTFNRINEAILHNKQINLINELSEGCEKREFLLLKPREIIFIERGEYEA